jgi:KUP system potassium uptake protein
MMTWRRGLQLVESARAHLRQPERDFVRTLERDPPLRLPGTAAFLASAPRGLPLALTSFVRHNHAIHQRVLIVTARAEEIPRVDDENRVQVIDIGPGISRVILHFGFMETASIPDGLRCAVERGWLTGVDLADLSYYVGRETIIPCEKVPGMAVWRETLFAFMQRNAERSAAYFQVPVRQVVEVGTEIEI